MQHQGEVDIIGPMANGTKARAMALAVICLAGAVLSIPAFSALLLWLLGLASLWWPIWIIVGALVAAVVTFLIVRRRNGFLLLWGLCVLLTVSRPPGVVVACRQYNSLTDAATVASISFAIFCLPILLIVFGVFLVSFLLTRKRPMM